MTAIELVATAFGLTSVALTVRQSIWCWPTGLVMVVLYVWVFYEARLYSDMLLHVVYIGLSIYGWYSWAGGGAREDELPVARLRRGTALAWIALGIAGTASLGYSMQRLTDASLPYWDAAVTVLSLIAQYLMARKILESWIFWITVDVLAIGVYFVKELYVTSGLYTVFLALATAGWFAWHRSIQQGRTEPVAA